MRGNLHRNPIVTTTGTAIVSVLHQSVHNSSVWLLNVFDFSLALPQNFFPNVLKDLGQNAHHKRNIFYKNLMKGT